MDQASIYYAGRITPWLGAFIQVTFDGVAQEAHIDNVDVRHAGDGQLFGQDMVWGVTVNNNPTVQDLWNSTPAWGFPYNSSPLAASPVAATLIDGTLAQRVAGAGAYMLWNDLIYVEADAYGGLDADALRFTGIPVSGGPTLEGAAPYGRLALQKDWENSHLEIGAYGLSANLVPQGFQQNGLTDRSRHLGFDANFQYIVNPKVGGQRHAAGACDSFMKTASLRASRR